MHQSTNNITDQKLQKTNNRKSTNLKIGSSKKRLPNLKQFKLQIDHEIAKCLDTLDRQGLKYLRQTIRASHIFSQIQQQQIIQGNLSQTNQQQNELKEKIKDVKDYRQGKNVIKSKSKNNNTKKLSKGKIIKNSYVKENLIVEDIQEIQEKIEEKIQEKIQEKIEEKIEEKISQNIKQNEQINQNVRKLPKINSRPISAFQKADKDIQSIRNSQFLMNHANNTQNMLKQPIKPFTSKKKQRPLYLQKQTTEIDLVSDGSIKQKLKKEQKIEIKQQQFIQNKQVKQQQYIKNQQNEITSNQDNIEYLINRISKLSPNKIQKLENILGKLQDQSIINMDNSLLNRQQKHHQYINKNKLQKNKSKKQEKASSLSSSIVKLNKQIDINQLKQINKDKYRYQNNNIFYKNKQSLINYSSVSQIETKIGQKQQNKNDQYNKNQINVYNEYNSNKQSCNQYKNSEEIKMLRISKKIKIHTKSINNKYNTLSIKIIKNRGHPTLVGLTNIQIYNIEGQKLQVKQQDIKKGGNKAIKLFNHSKTTNQYEMWVTQLDKALIEIAFRREEKIGGLKISNYNKSLMESNKQADWLQIYINQVKLWQGSVRNGCYNQIEEYAEEIKISQIFQFPKKQFIKDDDVQKQFKKPKWLQTSIIMKEIQEINTEAKLKEEKELFQQKPVLQMMLQPIKMPIKMNLIEQKLVQMNEQSSLKNELLNENISLTNMIKKDLIKQQLNCKKQINKIKIDNKQQLKDMKIIINKKLQNNQKNDFDSLLQSMQKYNKKDNIIISNNKNKSKQRQLKKQEQKQLNKFLNIVEEKEEEEKDDFMNDSIFKDKPKKKYKQIIKPINIIKDNNEVINTISNKCKQKKKSTIQRLNKQNEIDNLINELDDMMYDEYNIDEQVITIPELPIGNQIIITIISSWGNHNFIGLNGIQFFHSNGFKIQPLNILLCNSNQKVYNKIHKCNYLTSDQNLQWKTCLLKDKKIQIKIIFSAKIQLSMIRIWNYNGHRVHTNIGIKKCTIKLDAISIFKGQIRQSSGVTDQAYQCCQCIVFTNNIQIHKKINDNDWLQQILKKNNEQKQIFKKTIYNFHRPQTKNNKKNNENLYEQKNKQIIKIPKRLLYQYEIIQFPKVFTLKINLLTSWGDRNFIGLNGIQIYNHQGENINCKGQIKAFPSSVNCLSEISNDKRIVENLFNDRNQTTLDNDIWLAPLQSDIEKIQQGKPNTIWVQFSEIVCLGAINFYNYAKTPERGVHQIEIYLDYWLVFRGYLKKYQLHSKESTHTTIPFTNNTDLLTKVCFSNYNEDNKEQDIGLINELNVIRKPQIYALQNKNRPMTGKQNF